MGQRRLLDRVFFQGKPATDPALARTLAAVLEREVVVPADPGAMGAIGIALLASRALAAGDGSGGNGSGGNGTAAASAPAAVDLSRVLDARVAGRREFQCGDRDCLNSCHLELAEIDVGGLDRQDRERRPVPQVRRRLRGGGEAAQGRAEPVPRARRAAARADRGRGGAGRACGRRRGRRSRRSRRPARGPALRALPRRHAAVLPHAAPAPRLPRRGAAPRARHAGGGRPALRRAGRLRARQAAARAGRRRRGRLLRADLRAPAAAQRRRADVHVPDGAGRAGHGRASAARRGLAHARAAARALREGRRRVRRAAGQTIHRSSHACAGEGSRGRAAHACRVRRGLRGRRGCSAPVRGRPAHHRLARARVGARARLPGGADRRRDARHPRRRARRRHPRARRRQRRPAAAGGLLSAARGRAGNAAGALGQRRPDAAHDGGRRRRRRRLPAPARRLRLRPQLDDRAPLHRPHRGLAARGARERRPRRQGRLRHPRAGVSAQRAPLARDGGRRSLRGRGASGGRGPARRRGRRRRPRGGARRHGRRHAGAPRAPRPAPPAQPGRRLRPLHLRPRRRRPRPPSRRGDARRRLRRLLRRRAGRRGPARRRRRLLGQGVPALSAHLGQLRPLPRPGGGPARRQEGALPQRRQRLPGVPRQPLPAHRADLARPARPRRSRRGRRLQPRHRQRAHDARRLDGARGRRSAQHAPLLQLRGRGGAGRERRAVRGVLRPAGGDARAAPAGRRRRRQRDRGLPLLRPGGGAARRGRPRLPGAAARRGQVVRSARHLPLRRPVPARRRVGQRRPAAQAGRSRPARHLRALRGVLRAAAAPPDPGRRGAHEAP